MVKSKSMAGMICFWSVMKGCKIRVVVRDPWGGVYRPDLSTVYVSWWYNGRPFGGMAQAEDLELATISGLISGGYINGV